MKDEVDLKLRDAFVKTLNKKQSVSALCEKAEISRTTFYLYYKDMEEFLEKTKQNIAKKYFEQIIEMFFCKQDDLPLLVKSENLVFTQTDRNLLAYFVEGKKYIGFADLAAEDGLPYFKAVCKERYGEDFYLENERKIIYCLNGIAPMIFFNLVQYDEKKMLEEMYQSRKIINMVLGK